MTTLGSHIRRGCIACALFLLALGPASVPAAANELFVVRSSGDIVWRNNTGSSLNFGAYTVTSPGFDFVPAAWRSITNFGDANSGGSVDPDNNWFIINAATNDLSEGSLGFATIGAEADLLLGEGLWQPGNPQSLQFEYLDVSLAAIQPGIVTFVDHLLLADFDADGDVDANDLARWEDGFGTTGGATRAVGDANVDGVVDGADLLIWQREFGLDANPVSSGGGSLVAPGVPEPSTACLLAILAGGLWGLWRRR